MIGTLGLALALGAGVPAPLARAMDRAAAWRHGAEPLVTIWTQRDEDPYARGDRVRVFVRTERAFHLTVIRLDTDGRVRILFPNEPWEDTWTRGGRTLEVLGRRDAHAFTVDDPPGVGYVFAIASSEPFDFREITRGDRWDYRAVADGRVRGDPYVALTDLADRLAYDYDYDITPYFVDERYDYPRFVCYDCHTYAGYRSWDPYRATCSSFRLVIYDDPYYYPYRHYDGRGVVIVRPRRPAARYVFKDADPAQDYVTRVRRRPAVEERDRDRSRREPGAPGAAPTPVEPRRRVPADERPAVPPERRRDRPSAPVPDRGPPDDPRRRVEIPSPDRQAGEPEPRRREREAPAIKGREEPRRAPERQAEPEKRPEPVKRAEPRRKEPEERRDAKGDPELRRRRPPER